MSLWFVSKASCVLVQDNGVQVTLEWSVGSEAGACGGVEGTASYNAQDEVAGSGLGAVDVFDTAGNLYYTWFGADDLLLDTPNNAQYYQQAIVPYSAGKFVVQATNRTNPTRDLRAGIRPGGLILPGTVVGATTPI